MGRKRLHLEVEPHRRSHRQRLGPRHFGPKDFGPKDFSPKDFSQRGDARAVAWRLVGELRRIGRPRPDPPDIIGRELGQTQRADQRPTHRQPGAVGPPYEVRIERGIVADNRNPVGGHRHIELETVDADRQRGRKSRQRVLRKQAPRPAMALQIDRAPHVARVPLAGFAVVVSCATLRRRQRSG
jgi:hypothetical protein